MLTNHSVAGIAAQKYHIALHDSLRNAPMHAHMRTHTHTHAKTHTQGEAVSCGGEFWGWSEG